MRSMVEGAGAPARVIPGWRRGAPEGKGIQRNNAVAQRHLGADVAPVGRQERLRREFAALDPLPLR